MNEDLSAPAVAALDPFAPGFYEDPYKQYAALRESEPVHRTPFGPWLLTRWDDVHTLLRDPMTSVEDRNANISRRNEAFVEAAGHRAERGTRAILNIDPPDHTRLRRLVSKAFTPRTVERLHPKIDELVDQLLTDAVERGDGRMDVIADLAFPLPFAVISEMLGMPGGNDTQLRDWSHTLVQGLDPILALTKMDEIFEASDHLAEVITDAIEWKRGRPDDDDLLGDLIKAEDGGDVLSDRELIDNVLLLYVAGHETTVNLIGNGTLALLGHPEQAALVRSNPDLDGNAVEELLRYDSPVQFSRRIALRPLEIAGTAIEPGDFVMTGLGAANRDPGHFGPTAGQLDVTRPDANQHVSFGSGVHHCLGAALARLEARVAIPTMLRRFPDLTLNDESPAWNGRMILRGLDSLDVSLN